MGCRLVGCRGMEAAVLATAGATAAGTASARCTVKATCRVRAWLMACDAAKGR